MHGVVLLPGLVKLDLGIGGGLAGDGGEVLGVVLHFCLFILG